MLKVNSEIYDDGTRLETLNVTEKEEREQKCLDSPVYQAGSTMVENNSFNSPTAGTANLLVLYAATNSIKSLCFVWYTKRNLEQMFVKYF